MASLLVAACQSLPQPDVADHDSVWRNDLAHFSDGYRHIKSRQSWRYSAKVGLTTPDLREQANLVWENRDQNNTVRLFGPLGAGAVKLQFDNNGVVLSDNKGVLHRGNNAEQLLTRIVGWPIPIDALSFWMFAVPANGAAFRYTLDENQRVSELEQLGWRISYSDYKEYDDRIMPRKIVASKQLSSELLNGEDNTQNNKIVVKLITKNWK